MTKIPLRRTPQLTDKDYHTLAAFRFSLRQFVAFSDAAAREKGLTPRQHQALLGIKTAQRDGGASISDLATFLILHHNSAVELVDRLVSAGYVNRIDDIEDRRKIRLGLTETGEAQLLALSNIHLAEIARIRPALTQLLTQITTDVHSDDLISEKKGRG